VILTDEISYTSSLLLTGSEAETVALAYFSASSLPYLATLPE
jgi:hypothetical protein